MEQDTTREANKDASEDRSESPFNHPIVRAVPVLFADSTCQGVFHAGYTKKKEGLARTAGLSKVPLLLVRPFPRGCRVAYKGAEQHVKLSGGMFRLNALGSSFRTRFAVAFAPTTTDSSVMRRDSPIKTFCAAPQSHRISCYQ